MENTCPSSFLALLSYTVQKLPKTPFSAPTHKPSLFFPPPSWSSLKPAFLSFDQAVRHVRPQNMIPNWEKRLRIIILETLQLVVYVMICCIILKEQVKDVPRQPEAAVIINRLDHCKAEEKDSSAGCHARYQKGEDPTNSV